MDIFQELGKQTAKIVANFTGAMDELSSLANKSANSVSGIVKLRGQIESLKSELKNAYRDIGEKAVNNPGADVSAQIENAKNLQIELKKAETELETLKEQLQQDGKDTKDMLLNKTEKAFDTAKEDIEAKKDEVADYIETEVKEAEDAINNETDKVVDDLEDKPEETHTPPKSVVPESDASVKPAESKN